MAKLKFFARKDFLCNARPGATTATGQFPQYVNRALNMVDGAATWPAVAEPFACEEGSEVALNLVRKVKGKKDPALYPADEYTAAACGCEYVETEFKDGVHLPKQALPPKPPVKASRAKAED